MAFDGERGVNTPSAAVAPFNMVVEDRGGGDVGRFIRGVIFGVRRLCRVCMYAA